MNPLPEKLDSVVKKVNQINKANGPFDAVFLIGDSFTEKSSGEIGQIDPDTYYVEGSSSVSLEKLPDNVVLLNKPIQEVKGLKIGVIKGSEEIECDISKYGDLNLDILLAVSWPETLSRKTYTPNTIDHVIKATQPKYIFVAQGPYTTNVFHWSDTNRVTRFIGLGQYKSKDKWYYAFNFVEDDEKIPSNLIKSPFEESLKRPAPISHEVTKPEKKQKTIDPASCFFCLSNPKIEAHMIISVGTSTYLTIAKGPLTKPNLYANKPIAGHAIVIPIDHLSRVDPLQRFDLLTEDAVLKEALRFCSSLKRFYLASFEMGLCTYEINTNKSIHYHRQVFPINLHFSISKFRSFLDSFGRNTKGDRPRTEVDFSLLRKGQGGNYDQEEIKKIFGENKEYILIELSINNLDDDKLPGTYLFVSPIDSNKYLDLQYPRRVLAIFLNLKNRIRWNKCIESQEMETVETESFRRLFKDYDFTLE